MKFHIIQAGETIEKIKKMYKMDDDELSFLNPDYRIKKYEIGDRIRVKEDLTTTKIVENINTIYSSKKDKQNINEEKKYICPHCKNIIIIPK